MSEISGKTPKRISFAPDPKVYAAIEALRPVFGVSLRHNNWLYNFVLRGGLHAWLRTNKNPPIPWATISAWFEAHPEEQEITTEEFAPGSPQAAAIRERGHEVEGPDTDVISGVYAVSRNHADHSYQKEVEDHADIVRAFNTINELLGGWH